MRKSKQTNFKLKFQLKKTKALLSEKLDLNRSLLVENVNFSNWKMPDENQLKLEFKVEQTFKGANFFDDYEDFRERVRQAKIVEIDEQEDYNISYRSRTRSKSSLLSLIRNYASYPEFRNEDTVEDIYTGYKQNKPMDYPIVIEFRNGDKRIFSGNTRMDVAFQLGINPKVLLVQSDR